MPAGTPVNFQLTSATVWNVFFVPQIGSMIYTMPRMTTRLHLQADRQGVYDGLSGHFSGDGFSGHAVQGARRFRRSSSPPGRRAPAGRARRSTARAYAELLKPSSYVKPMTYGAVAPGLFDAIVAEQGAAAAAAAAQSDQQPSRGSEACSVS